MASTIRGALLVAAFALVAAACANDPAPSSEEPDPSTSTTATGPSASLSTKPDALDGGGAPASNGSVTGDLTFTLDDGYTAVEIGEGVKPDLALDSDGSPGVAYLLEDLAGFIAYADQTSGWVGERVVDGYFYGPIGLAFAPDGTPLVAYHDHQDTTFEQDKGDLTIATRTGTGWTVDAVADDGHDGWDSTIAIEADGIVRAAGIDPEQFGRTQGVEYYELTDGEWDISEIGSGPVAYEFNVSLAVDPAGNPAITYYDTTNGDLEFAARRDGIWSIETVDSDGDVGRYSSLAFDGEGTPHISYLRLDGASAGTVRYATPEDGRWAITDVDQVTELRTGFTGARRVTVIDIDLEDRPQIVNSDEGTVRRAVAGGGDWTVSTIVAAGDRPLGQLVSFELATDGTLHLAIFEVVSESPLTGISAYITDG